MSDPESPTPAEIMHPVGDTPPEGADPWVAGAIPTYDIEIVPYDDTWPAAYEAVATVLRVALGGNVLMVQHVGSTSVPGLAAKPIIDIDLTVPDPEDEASYLPALGAAGFELRVREPWWYGHRCLRRRVESEAVNLHVFAPGAPEPVRHRLFRDWLREHADDRTLYAEVKRESMRSANAAGEHTMQYNARKEPVILAIYQRIFSDRGWV